MNISVAMTAYQGEKYIRDQIDSILPQLDISDEIIISYDKCTDSTLIIIEEIARNDGRIKVIKGPCKGAIANFENAIQNCRNEYIFLCDQDDVWKDNKVLVVMKKFKETNAMVILHDAVIVNEDLETIEESFFSKRGCKQGMLNNIIKNSYIGCCMAFKRQLIEHILPFPDNLPMHDQWIGIIGERYGKVCFLDEKLIFYRRHENNVSSDSHSNIIQMIKWRIRIVMALLSRRKNGN